MEQGIAENPDSTENGVEGSEWYNGSIVNFDKEAHRSMA